MAQCDGKYRHATERAALNELKRFRRDRFLGGHAVRWMNVYECPRCKGFHIGHDTNALKLQAEKAAAEEFRKLKRRVEAIGKAILNDELRYFRKRLAEIGSLVEEDRKRTA